MRIKDTIAQVLANPALRGLQASWLIGIAAEKAYLVALLVFAYEIGGVVAVGVFTMLASLPSGLLGPVLSSVAESFAPARALLGLHLGRAAVVAAAAIAVAADLGIWIVVAAAITEGILSRQHTATTRALLPALARTPEELVASNGVTSVAEGVGSLIGPVGAGVLLLVGGPPSGWPSRPPRTSWRPSSSSRSTSRAPCEAGRSRRIFGVDWSRRSAGSGR